jgi:protein-tyrosine phosphatase
MESILQCQPNFRDMGGIMTVDGRKIRRGLIFRSGDFNGLSDGDLLRMEELNIKTIVDFRSSREREKRPDRLAKSVKQIIHLEIHDEARDTAAAYFAADDASGLESVLIGDYARMVTMYLPEFRQFFEVLSDKSNLPLVFHCAAGKDRTGLAAVFFLTALGVSMPVVWDDYLASNRYQKDYTEKAIGRIRESGLNGDILRPLFEVRREYLQAALDRISQEYPKPEYFAASALGAQPGVLRGIYLE